jgi:hypothetical protein
MYKTFNFTEKVGDTGSKYDTIDDVDVIKKFAKKIKEEFEWHVHEDHSNYPHIKEKCSYVNYHIYGEVMFRQTSMIPKNEIPQEYFILGDRVKIYIKNVRSSKQHNHDRIGIEGHVTLLDVKSLEDFDPIISMIENLSKGKGR